MVERDLARDLASLTQPHNDRVDEQLLRVGMDMGIEANTGGDDTGSDIRAAFHMDAAVGAENTGMSCAGEVEMSSTLRRKGVAGDGIQQAHVEVTHRCGLPTGAGKVFERSGNDEIMAIGREPKRTQVSGASGEIQRGLKAPLRRLCCWSWNATERIYMGGSGFNPVGFGKALGRGNVCDAEGDVAGIEVEQSATALEVEGRGAILVIQFTLID